MLHVQVRNAADQPWRNVYIISATDDDVRGQKRQARETNAFYDFQRVRIIETLGDEFVREIALEANTEWRLPEGEILDMFRAAAERIAARYQAERLRREGDKVDATAQALILAGAAA